METYRAGSAHGVQLRPLCVPVLALVAAMHANPSWAGGILIYEAGQEGNGMANAGSAALANDPSVLMSNPAGITQLKGTQICAGHSRRLAIHP